MRIRNKLDQSILSLALTNLFVILIAIFEDWEIGLVMLIYVLQNIVIGVYKVVEILNLNNFSTTGMTTNKNPLPETNEGRRHTTFMFTFIFGSFNVGYIAVIFTETEPIPKDMISTIYILISLLFFIRSHHISYRISMKKHIGRKPHLGAMQVQTLIRVLPMHLGVFLLALNAPIWVFMLLKSVVDIGSEKMTRSEFIYK